MNDSECQADAISAGVLVGGHGRRMGGADKARLLVGGQTLVARLLNELRGHVAHTFLLRRNDQSFADIAAQSLVDARPDSGPLGGLVALLRAAPTAWCWLVAVDMPAVHGTLLTNLTAARTPNIDALAYTDAFGPQPTCALYHRRCLPQAEAMLRAGDFAMHRLLSRVRFKGITLPPRVALTNLNSAADLVAFNAAGAS